MDADDVLLGDGCDVGHSLLHVAQQWVGDVAVAVRDRHEHGGDRHRDQRELPRDDEDDDPDADDREDVLEEEDEAVAEEEAHALQVDGRAAHQLAGLMPVVEAEREADKLRVDGLAHVHLHGERLAARDQPPAGHLDGTHEAEHDHERDEPFEAVELVAAQCTDDASGQEDRDERRCLRADREQHRQDHRHLVGLQERDEPEKRGAVARRS